MKFKLELQQKGSITSDSDKVKVCELDLPMESGLVDRVSGKEGIFHLDLNGVYLDLEEELIKHFSKMQPCHSIHLYIDKMHAGLGKELANAISTIIQKQPLICLSLNELVPGSSDELTQMVETLSGMEKTFTLAVNELPGDSDDELVSAVSVLSGAIPSFRLTIPEVDAELLPRILAAISQKVRSVNLGRCKLGDTGEDFAQVMGAIHQLVEVLDLEENGLGNLVATYLAEGFQCLPAGLKILKLGDNQLHNMSAGDLAAALQSISVCLMSIDLYLNDFSRFSGMELNSILKSLPKTLTQLQLRANDLFTMKASELITAFTDFHENVTLLDLGYNLDESGPIKPPSDNKMIRLFEALPRTVKQLDLCGNCLGWLPGLALENIFSCVEPNIIWLGLGSNHLYDKSGATLADAFNELPDSLRAIDLGDNYLSKKTDAELLQLLMGFKDNVTSIGLEKNGLFDNKTPAQRDALLIALRQVNPEGDRLELAHNGESVIARAAVPLLSAIRQYMMHEDIINDLILPHLSPTKGIIKGAFKYPFFRQVTERRVQEQEKSEAAIETRIVPMEIEPGPAEMSGTLKRQHEPDDSEQATKKIKV